ncbi:MAG TPA: sulfotransferase [Allosphingosinicella sp.]|nr:sulfotransferase [Allosphingosinicella sp.]
MSKDPSPAVETEPVHLIHIGWAKAGSTFLQNWFAAHPQIAFSHHGIAGFDGTFDLIRHAGLPGDARCRVTSAEALSTPHPFAGVRDFDLHALAHHDAHAAQARGCRLLRQLFPSARILIVTRGARSLLLSGYSQYVRTGGDLSFAGFLEMAACAHWWDYDRVIRLYEQAFGTENVLVLPYERLRDDPESFCRPIEAHLRIPPGTVPHARANRSVSGAALAWYPRLNRLLGRLPRRGLVRRLYWRAIVGDRLAGLAALLQRVHPLKVPGPADIPDDFLRTLARQCESLRNRPSHAPYLREYGLAGEETP